MLVFRGVCILSQYSTWFHVPLGRGSKSYKPSMALWICRENFWHGKNDSNFHNPIQNRRVCDEWKPFEVLVKPTCGGVFFCTRGLDVMLMFLGHSPFKKLEINIVLLQSHQDFRAFLGSGKTPKKTILESWKPGSSPQSLTYWLMATRNPVNSPVGCFQK